MGGPLALDGRRLMGGHNNQPKVGINGEGGVREETRPGRNVWGTLSHCLGRRMEASDKKKSRDGLGLGHRRPLIKNFTHNNQLKTGSRDGGDYEGEAQRAGGSGEARYHCFWEALQLNGG
jgi:hypothetical protein